MPDLSNLTQEQFESHLTQPFQVKSFDSPLTLVLVEVTKRGSFDPGIQKRHPFSLIFRGPMEPALPQMTYPLTHEVLGDLALFLVPVGPDNEGMCYEAVFT